MSLNLTALLTDMGSVVTFTTSSITDILTVLMTPPLVVFIGLGVAAVVIGMTKGLVKRKR
jgi:type II secretory pathway component PulF